MKMFSMTTKTLSKLVLFNREELESLGRKTLQVFSTKASNINVNTLQKEVEVRDVRHTLP